MCSPVVNISAFYLSPSFIHTRLRRLTTKLSQSQVIDVAFRATAVISGGIVRVQWRTQATSLGQVGIGNEFSRKSNQIRAAASEPRFGAVLVEAARRRSAATTSHICTL